MAKSAPQVWANCRDAFAIAAIRHATNVSSHDGDILTFGMRKPTLSKLFAIGGVHLAHLMRRTAGWLCMCASVAGATAIAQPVRSTVQPDFNPTIDAARMLTQASFGATRAEIDRVAGIGANAWITEQFAKAARSYIPNTLAYQDAGNYYFNPAVGSLWKQIFEGEDQLRQRMVFALSQIMVISLRNSTLASQPCGAASYMDTLGKHAFGNFRDLLKDVTLQPAMGEYLDMKRSGKTLTVNNPEGALVKFYPNENYARELLQLFSIGTVMLNLDGSPKLDGAGKAIASYDESIVKGFAQAFTGWTFSPDKARDPQWNEPSRWLYAFYPSETQFPTASERNAVLCSQWTKPMEPWLVNRAQSGNYDVCNRQQEAGQVPDYSTCVKPDLPPPHETGAKKLLSGTMLAANQTPMQDMDAAIDNIFNHPNVGPFIGKQLIQRLTMSNPQPPYVERVAKAFNDNGKGVRGDMKSVIRAILMDPDVRLHMRAEGPLAGKLKEPIVRFVQFLRAFNSRAAAGYYELPDLSAPDSLYQSPLAAPSVFNFYRPDTPLPGQPAYAKALAPEFQLATANAIAAWADFSDGYMIRGYGSWNEGADIGKHIKPDYTTYIALAQTNPAKLIDELTIVLLNGTITPAFRTELIRAVTNTPPPDQYTQPVEKLNVALWLIVNSPEFLIQK